MVGGVSVNQLVNKFSLFLLSAYVEKHMLLELNSFFNRLIYENVIERESGMKRDK
jgi:hypothetical protein